MRRRPSTLLVGTIAALSGLLIGGSASHYVAKSHGQAPQPVSLAAAGPTAAPQALVAPPEPTANLDVVARRATTDAARNGADMSFTLLDRKTGRLISSGDDAAFPIASVAKLFIADDLLTQSVAKKAPLSPEDRHGLEVMLRSSDDLAADEFWIRGGGNAVIDRVVARYKLSKTTAPYDGNWWNTMSSTADLVRFYSKLLDGSGGLPQAQVNLILGNLAASSPLGADGYPQRFGIPDGLFAEPVAVKQGWMCCWNMDNWVHMSTGVVGTDRRYVIAIGSMQPVDDVTARNTMTDTIKKMFPGGRI